MDTEAPLASSAFVSSIPDAKKAKNSESTEVRKITVPHNRVRPLKGNWKKIFDPVVEMLGLQIR
jgi:RNA-binding protein PNO1